MTYGEPYVDALIAEYTKHPVNNFRMEECTISRHEGNFICGDDITVYLKIDGDSISDFSFDGNCSTITTAAASLLAELIVGKSISEVMEWGYDTIAANGLDVSPRRRRAAVISLLAVRNAIYRYQNVVDPVSGEIKVEEFEDLLDD